MVRVRRIIITNIQLIVPAKKAPTNYWPLSQPPPQGLKCKYDISFKVTEENLGLFRKVISLVIFQRIADFLLKYLTIFNLSQQCARTDLNKRFLPKTMTTTR